jgi:hypothetical protein
VREAPYCNAQSPFIDGNEYSDFDTLNGWFRYALIEIK